MPRSPSHGPEGCWSSLQPGCSASSRPARCPPPFLLSCSPFQQPQPESLQRALPFQEQDFASVLAELAGLGDLEGFFQARCYHDSVNFVRFPLAPFLQPLRFFPDCGPALSHISWCPLFGVCCKLHKCALHHLLCSLMKVLIRTCSRIDSSSTPCLAGLWLD